MASPFHQPSDIPVPVLTMLANRLLVDPFSPSYGPQLENLREDEADALKLLLDRLKLSLKQVREARDAQSRLLSEISDLLRVRTLTPDNKREAFNSLGQRGLLQLTAYGVQFASDWAFFESSFNERRSRVAQILQAPSAVRHLMPENRDSHAPPVSLIAKRIDTKSTKPFVMLVIAERLESMLRVYSAWRIPGDLVAPASDPFNLLETFVDRFGVMMMIPGRPSRKFIHYESVPLPPGLDEPSSRLPLALQSPDTPAIGTAVYKRTHQACEIAIAFAINLSRYQQLLKDLKD